MHSSFLCSNDYVSSIVPYRSVAFAKTFQKIISYYFSVCVLMLFILIYSNRTLVLKLYSPNNFILIHFTNIQGIKMLVKNTYFNNVGYRYSEAIIS